MEIRNINIRNPHHRGGTFLREFETEENLYRLAISDSHCHLYHVIEGGYHSPLGKSLRCQEGIGGRPALPSDAYVADCIQTYEKLMASQVTLNEMYNMWVENHGLPLMSAEELLAEIDDDMDPDRLMRDWLGHFIEMYNHLFNMENNVMFRGG